MPDVTAQLAQMLFEKGVTATFFVLGERAEADQLKRIVQHGHRIGNHTYSHPNFDCCGGRLEEIVPDEINRCHVRIEAFVPKPIAFRAPGGGWRNPVCTTAANNLPYADRYVGPYGWDIDAKDWGLNRRHGKEDKITLDEFSDGFKTKITEKRGGIILLHDGFPSNESRDADPNEIQAINVVTFVLDEIARQGFRLVDLKLPSQ